MRQALNERRVADAEVQRALARQQNAEEELTRLFSRKRGIEDEEREANRQLEVARSEMHEASHRIIAANQRKVAIDWKIQEHQSRVAEAEEILSEIIREEDEDFKLRETGIVGFTEGDPDEKSAVNCTVLYKVDQILCLD